MKSEEWFSEECFQYAQTTEMLVDFAKRIYTEGRRDQLGESVCAVSNYQQSLGHATMSAADNALFNGIRDAIRAAGPGENE